MTRELEDLAREAGFDVDSGIIYAAAEQPVSADYAPCTAALTRFAALVRADERERAAQTCLAQIDALCDRYGIGAECIASCEECAAAIRAMGEQQ